MKILIDKRNEIVAEIRSLTESLRHLDATIKLFAPEYHAPRGKGVMREVLNTLREAGKPMSVREIAEATGFDIKQIQAALYAQKKKGVVSSEKLGWWGLI